MSYTAALKMPSSYAVMNEEEMTYLEGGDYYISNEDCKAILFALGATAASSPVAVATLITSVSSGTLAATLGTIPVIGQIIAGYGIWAIVNSAESFSSALCTAVLSNKGISVELGFKWFSPYIKSTVK